MSMFPLGLCGNTGDRGSSTHLPHHSWTVSTGLPLTLPHLCYGGRKYSFPTWPPQALQSPAGLLDTTPVQGLNSSLQPDKGWSLGSPFTLCWQGWQVEKGTVFSVVFGFSRAVIIQKFSILWGCSLPKLWPEVTDFCWAFVACASGVSRLPVFSAPSLEYMRQKENPRNPRPSSWLGPHIPSPIPSPLSSLFRGFLHLFYM